MSDESSMTRYSAEAFGAVCEEVRYLKTVVESQNTYIETLKADSGRKETEENLTAQLRDAWKECDQARAKVEKLERVRDAAILVRDSSHQERIALPPAATNCDISYAQGVADGHRCAAKMVKEALAACEEGE